MASDNIVNAHLQQRRGTAALWTQVNPVLGAGEIGYVTDTKAIKIGDGVTAWKNLPEFKAVNAGNADTLGGVAPSGYLAVNGKAVDADKLDGYDTATAATPSTVAVRDAAGRLTVATPAASTDASTKGYVDTQVASAVAPPIPNEMYLSTLSFRYNAVTPSGAAINSTIYAIAWSPTLNMFAAVGATGGVITSPDGVNWTTRPISPVSTNPTFRDVIWISDWFGQGTGAFLAIGANAYTWGLKSTDGITWSQVSVPSLGMNIAYSPAQKKLVMPCSSNAAYVYYTTDPTLTSWGVATGVGSSTSGYNTSICWSPELSLWVFGYYSGGSTCIYTSPDALTWTPRATAASSYPQSIAWSPALRLFVMVSSMTTSIQTSPDGITWTSRNNPSGSALYKVIWSPELGHFIASGLGSNSISNGYWSAIITSPDGIVWTSRAPNYGAGFYGLAVSNTKKQLVATMQTAGGPFLISPAAS